jgi:hypothetical protein
MKQKFQKPQSYQYFPCAVNNFVKYSISKNMNFPKICKIWYEFIDNQQFDSDFKPPVSVNRGMANYTNCIIKCAESAFKYLHRLMPIHYQRALDIKRILISNQYYLIFKMMKIYLRRFKGLVCTD